MSVIDHWDWIRYALGFALIACNIGVWRGVALEESHDRFDKEVGKTLLIRSLALEALFAALLFVVDTAGSIQQKADIAGLYDRATKAELELGKLTHPRIITKLHTDDLVTRLRQYSGAKFWIITERNDQDLGSEQMLLSNQLLTIFLAAGWTRSNHLSVDQTVAETEFAPVSDRGCNWQRLGMPAAWHYAKPYLTP